MELFNKPKVFLSHSIKDEKFIKKISSDLRQCHIDYWFYKEDVRHGKSFQKAIFGEGIPSCDAVMVYLTDNSLQSMMVEKEIDASLLSQMQDTGIAFLPYVNSVETRKKLRSDIASLDCREWNSKNYNKILPTVVAEIWHSFMDRAIRLATAQEKNKRYELEKKVADFERLQSNSQFTPSEQTDFGFIFSKLSEPIDILFTLYEADADRPGTSTAKSNDLIRINILKLLLYCIDLGMRELDYHTFTHFINELAKADALKEAAKDNRMYYSTHFFPHEALIPIRYCGLTNPTLHKKYEGGTDEHVDVFNEKMYRFRYWLEYNKMLDKSSPIQILERNPVQ